MFKDFAIHLIKEKCAYVSCDLKQSFAEYGYTFDFLNELAADDMTYFHSMPSDILAYMGKFVTNKVLKNLKEIIYFQGFNNF